MIDKEGTEAAALKEKAERKAEEYRKGKGTSGSDSGLKRPDEVVVVTRRFTCPGCGDEVEAEAVKLGAGRYLMPRRCDECLRAEEEREVGRIDVYRRLEEIGFNVRRHGRARLDDFSGFDAHGPAIEWLDTVSSLRHWQEVRSLYLMGPTGTGKTSLMAAMCRDLIETGYAGSMVFVRARALITTIQDQYGKGTVDRTLDKLRRVSVLFLDDAGTEKVTADAFRIIDDLLDAREGWPTVWSSNDGPEDLVARWADEGISTHRFRSRLAGFRFLPVEGKDRRFTS